MAVRDRRGGALFIALVLAACGEDVAPPGTASQFCVTREIATCERECLAGRSPFDDCYAVAGAPCTARHDEITAQCAGETSPAGCTPTRRAQLTCIAVLRDASRRGEPLASLVECSSARLCGE